MIHSNWLNQAHSAGLSCTHRYIADLLSQQHSVVACLEEAPWVVYSWAVYDPGFPLTLSGSPSLKFIYTKDMVRRCGLAMWLLFQAFGGRQFTLEAPTKMGRALQEKYDRYRDSGEAEALREEYARRSDEASERVA